MSDRLGPRWLDQDQQRSWRAYIMGTTLLLGQLDRELRQAHGISLPEYELLVRLSEAEGRCLRMALLADAMSFSRSRITHTVARLEQMGVVERTATDDDRRGVTARLTARGWDLLEKAAPVHVTGVREHLVDIASDEDFAAVGRAFNAVCDHLIADHAPAADIRQG
ncbi:MarR family winged helix-turn-helix transcriptional regulator [Nocardioides terrisoli]|uniref:MarR family winged helix-turn-helix transcriptional regulator n=1 Tax=Nocardioides terrisoli TaxID=3388267 RepID=UPI00287B95BA|nr:MarR family transcriptional regulator [Nocardioides marmorisolisilvae]